MSLFEMPEMPKLEINFGINSDKIENRYIKPKKTNHVPVKKVIYDNAKKLALSIKPEINARHYCIVSGNFIFGDFLESFLLDWNFDVKEISITTLALSQNNVDSIKNIMLFSGCDKLNLMVSRYFYGHEIRKLIPYIYKELDFENKFQLGICDNHSKIAQFETRKGNKFVIYGSANLRASQNIEQFTVEQNSEIYDFNQSYFDLILEKYKTVQKAIGYKDLISLISEVESDTDIQDLINGNGTF